MIKIHKHILWVITVLIFSVGPYCFSQSQTYSASDLACKPPGSTDLNVLHNQIGVPAQTAVLTGCHGDVNDGANENSDNFVRGVEVASGRIVAQGSQGSLTEVEEVDKRAGLSSGRRSWREIFINW